MLAASAAGESATSTSSWASRHSESRVRPRLAVRSTRGRQPVIRRCAGRRGRAREVAAEPAWPLARRALDQSSWSRGGVPHVHRCRGRPPSHPRPARLNRAAGPTSRRPRVARARLFASNPPAGAAVASTTTSPPPDPHPSRPDRARRARRRRGRRPSRRRPLVDLGRRRARPPAPARLGDHRSRRRRHRPRRAQDRQGGRRPPRRARRARHRPTRADGRQALPQRPAPHVPPRRGLPRGPPGAALPRDARDGHAHGVRPRSALRPVGERRVRGAHPALARGRAGALPGAAARARS